ncbi:hypothetical protein KP509_33G016800 [Ceratopteris richardii]|uniref:Secreted protein n=1 Tax=Ceratopteris richardii TaxID=49495 RepID=A0A8T2QNQ0_CERRI|nr:hypothetical protein KP509_33G016800 [Ceratopteris richardii]
MCHRHLACLLPLSLSNFICAPLSSSDGLSPDQSLSLHLRSLSVNLYTAAPTAVEHYLLRTRNAASSHWLPPFSLPKYILASLPFSISLSSAD